MKTQKGILYKQENGCQMFLSIGKWNKAAKKPNYHWLMISEVTGNHEVITTSNRPDERVNNHWDGFIKNQPSCSFCGSNDLIDIDDNYTFCNKCNQSFVG